MKPVLLIEDDIVDALTVKRAFKELGVNNELLHRQNGEEALALVAEQPHLSPALILLDLNMPKMGGFEFLENIKKNNLLPEAPVVVLTTSTETQDRMQSQDYQIAGYLVKPVNFQTFLEMIHSLHPFLSFN